MIQIKNPESIAKPRDLKAIYSDCVIATIDEKICMISTNPINQIYEEKHNFKTIKDNNNKQLQEWW